MVPGDVVPDNVTVYMDRQSQPEWDSNQVGQYAAVLWIPDPEQRHGWREYYVRRPDPPKPGGRKVGF